MKKEILRMEHVCVQNSGRLVLDDFHMNIYEGEFLFVYGFPDSGIRELGQVLKGTCEYQSGNILVNEKPVNAEAFRDPGRYGIYIVQNENNLVDDFSVAENLFFGGKKHIFQKTIAKKQQERMAEKLLEKFDLKIDAAQKARNLDYFRQIFLKLAMAYVRGARLVVLDGIIGFIRGRDAQMLESILRILISDGISILWINQRMDYAREMADRFLILRQGKNIRTVFKGREEVLDTVLNIGMRDQKNNDELDPEAQCANDDIIFRMDNIHTSWFSDLSLRISKGEIVTICSSASQAIAQLRDIICGEFREYSGRMLLDRYRYQPRSYAESMSCGVCYVDLMWYERHGNPDMSIEDNMLLETWWKQKKTTGFLKNSVREHEKVMYRMGHPGWPADRWGSLSADQQKILILERLCMQPHRLVIITEPFFQLHKSLLNRFCDLICNIRDNNGAVILMAASDYDCRRVCDRVVNLDQLIKQDPV